MANNAINRELSRLTADAIAAGFPVTKVKTGLRALEVAQLNWKEKNAEFWAKKKKES